jgi:acyl-homoserine lactone acylase PvdQ
MEKQLNEGSNNWVVAPTRTATGRAMLANDPHRQLGVPSLRYVVGLNAPGLNIIGAGEPALPGVSIGHNADIAFGITIFAMDQEDLYVYELNPKAQGSYRYKGKWEPMTVVNETIEVKGEAPRKIDLRFTRHGPVLKTDEAKHRAFAMRSVWAEPGLSGYFGSSRLTHARTWDDFKAASNAWGAPPLNLVYADVSGNIGWAASGRTPVRKNWDGLMPVPGEGPAAVELQSRRGLLCDGQRIQPAEGLSGGAAQGRLRVDRSLPRQPHQGNPRGGFERHHRRLDGDPDRLDQRAVTPRRRPARACHLDECRCRQGARLPAQMGQQRARR